MIDRSDAVNLAMDMRERGTIATPLGARGLADAVLRMDEYIRSIEAVERDAARYRWMRDHDMTLEYCEYITGNLNGRAVDPLDGTVDAASLLK